MGKALEMVIKPRDYTLDIDFYSAMKGHEQVSCRFYPGSNKFHHCAERVDPQVQSTQQAKALLHAQT